MTTMIENEQAAFVQAPTPAANKPLRKRALTILGGAVLLAAVGYPAYSYVFGAPSQETDDAYVAGDIVSITAREQGTVIAIHADNTQAVSKGQTLIELDPATTDVNLAAAEAELARSVRRVRSAFAQVDESQAEILSAQAEAARARDDLARRQRAVLDGSVSGEEVAHAADAVRTSNAALVVAQSRRAQALAAVSNTSVTNNPEVLAAEAQVRRAAISSGHMRIVAPTDGVVAQRSVQIGQQIAPGMPLMAVVPLRNVWIDANFRETQLRDLRAGQPVTIVSDVYGKRTVFHGHVLGLGAGSGNAFALLPPQNASGNWIKIVQRVPVRIALNPKELAANPLQIGVSVKVTVDTSRHDGAAVAPLASRVIRSETSEEAGSAVEKRIDQIVTANRAGLAQ